MITRVWAFDVRAVPRPNCPRSVDDAIWPAIFEGGQEALRPDPQATFRCGDDLWNDLEVMTKALEELQLSGQRIVIEADIPVGATVDEVPSNRLYQLVVPSHVPAGFVLLGYDIADASCFSALCNCGYTVADLQNLVSWPVKLNENGLLPDRDLAHACLPLLDSLTGHHGPFLVYGVYGEELNL
jgi:hypothetical protein